MIPSQPQRIDGSSGREKERRRGSVGQNLDTYKTREAKFNLNICSPLTNRKREGYINLKQTILEFKRTEIEV